MEEVPTVYSSFEGDSKGSCKGLLRGTRRVEGFKVLRCITSHYLTYSYTSYSVIFYCITVDHLVVNNMISSVILQTMT